ncbi:acyltransferase [Candidatus Electrothrix sp.]|uniref:acyltransferase n=1 Tax=Candidatus Electrothrix sp. TaxID=2170559 RepID=UPI0040562771
MLEAASFFDLTEFDHKKIFQGTDAVWGGLINLKTYMNSQDYSAFKHEELLDGVPLKNHLIYYNNCLHSSKGCAISWDNVGKGKLSVLRDGQPLPGASVIMAGVVIMGQKIQLGKGVMIESGSLIKGPAIIGDHTEVRQGAYIRGYCLTGKRCVIGHATEVKHSIFFNDAKAGHFAYLGDSILGNDANLGAGTKFANLRFLPGNVQLRTDKGLIDTGLRKFGAILGDRVQTGCNSVTNPGTLIGPDGILMPNTTADSGLHPSKKIIR